MLNAIYLDFLICMKFLKCGGFEDWKMGDLGGSWEILVVLGGTLGVLGRYLRGTWGVLGGTF